MRIVYFPLHRLIIFSDVHFLDHPFFGPPTFGERYFKRVKDILFKFWHPSTPAQFYLSCLSVLVIGLVYELLKACQLKFIQRYSFRPADHMCLGEFIYSDPESKT